MNILQTRAAAAGTDAASEETDSKFIIEEKYMKIAIPADGNTEKAKVNLSFGRTPYFMLYDSEDDKMTFFDNSAAQSQGGAGIKASQSIIDKGVEAVIAPSCGTNAADVLSSAGISIYMANGDSLEKNIKDFQAGKLSLLKGIHEGFHRHGG